MSDTETGWLIEKNGVNIWWTGTCWTADSWQAIRFARQCDAEKAAKAFGLTDYWAGEHTWIGREHQDE